MQLSFNIFKKCKISFSKTVQQICKDTDVEKTKKAFHFLGVFTREEQLRCNVCKISGNVGSQSTSRSRLRIGGSLVPWVCTAQCPVCSFVHTKSATGTLHTFAYCTLHTAHWRTLHTFAHFCAVQTCVACKLQPWVRCLGPTPARPQCRWTFNATFAKKNDDLSLRPFNCKLQKDTSYNFDVFQEPMSETWDCLLCRLTPQHDLKKIGFWGKLPIIITVRLELIVLDAKKLDFINKKSALCTISAKFSIYGFTVWGLKANELLDLRGLQVTFMTSAALTSLFSSEICSKSSFSRLKFFEWLSVDERNIWEVQSMTTARKFQR